ncbi:MAG: T9SS type A sorting domain-containing protein [Bacteroidales bacterium]|nr:T9SS type A sorting domain-containing protein [Bacteroidales bacterium]
MKKLLFSIFLLIPIAVSAQLRVFAGNDTTFCESCVSKGTVILGTNLKIENGTAPYTYKWTTKYHLGGKFYEYAKDVLVDSTASVPVFKSSFPNKIWQPFVVEVKDANQQIARDTINVRFSGFILSASYFSLSQRMGDEIELNYSNIGEGIEPYRSYSWSPTVGLSSPNTLSTKCRVIGNQRYTLRVVDSVGCVAEDTPYDVRVPDAEAPVLGTTDSWNVASINWGAITGVENLTLKGDTLIDSKLYKSVYSTIDTMYIAAKASYKFGIREENSKWYFRFKNENSEQLLYDFSLKQSDTISVIVDGSYVKYSIIKVDTIPLNGQFRKRLYIGLYNSDGKSYYTYNDWIEGVGSTQGLVYNSPYLMDSGTDLLCYHKNGELVYFNPTNKSCGLGLGIKSTRINSDPIVAPVLNTNGLFKISYGREIEQLAVLDMQGRTMMQLTPFDNSVALSLANQPKGIYILRLKSADGVFVKKIVRR